MNHPSSHYLVSLRFKGRELGEWRVGTPGLKIGRTAENHIVIDNLGVSRLHATIEMTGQGAVVRDCDSLNGILVNGRRVERAVLAHGDVVTIGKHEIVCRVAGPDGNVVADPSLFEATLRAGSLDPPGPVANPAFLAEASPGRERQYVLDRGLMIIGSDEAADIEVSGRGIAPYHAEIRFLDGRYAIRHLHGKARVRVDGQTVREYMLTDGCSIVIGDFTFVFHSHAGVASDPQ